MQYTKTKKLKFKKYVIIFKNNMYLLMQVSNLQHSAKGRRGECEAPRINLFKLKTKKMWKTMSRHLMQFKQLVILKNIPINQLEVEDGKSFPSGSGRMRVSRACYIVSSKHMYSDAPLSDCTLLSHSTTKA